MKLRDVKSLNEKELDEKLTELTKDLIKLNAQAAIGSQLKSPGQINQIKRAIAIIKTRKNNMESNKA